MKKLRAFLSLLLTAVIVFSAAACSDTVEEEDNGDYHFMGSAYDRRIFGSYRFQRLGKENQEIYYGENYEPPPGTSYDENGKVIGIDYPRKTYAHGIIEKYMHDGKRYIAYHLTPNKYTDPAIDAPCYAILDTQTEETVRFPDVGALSDEIHARALTFGNWFYTAHADSAEGKRTPLFGDYALEDMDNQYYGRSILYREQPIFYGILNHVRTDGTRYIAFRERTVQNDRVWLFREIVTEEERIWYDDPITNTMLSESAPERLGLFRRSFLQYCPVVYDKYVLWDTQTNSVQEFDKQGQLDKYCKAQNIVLQKEIVR